MTAPCALGPGDSDGKPNIGTPEEARPPLGPGDSVRPRQASAEGGTAPLGPGDDDGRENRGTPLTTAEPLAPGDSDGKNPEDGTFETVAPTPAAPGASPRSARVVTRIPKGRPSPTTAAADSEE